MGDAVTELHTALFRFGTDRTWLRFDDPIETVTVWDLDDVLPAIERAEAASRNGQWVVGLLSYDAGPAFDAAVKSQRDESTPLLAYGIFERGESSPGPIDAPFQVGDWVPDQSEEAYGKAIDAVRSYISAGETYQVNYTVRRLSLIHI